MVLAAASSTLVAPGARHGWDIPAEGHARRVRALRPEIHRIVDEVTDRGRFHFGPQTAALEQRMRAEWGGHPVATTSCTQALALALRTAGVGEGDEVVVPAATFAATAFAVAGLGAVPVVVDVDEPTLTMSPEALRGAVTRRTRAVIPVHLHGHMADMPALLAVAAEHRLAVVEDCAQASGAALYGRAAGTWGDFGCFSFWVGKCVGGLADGGAVITDSEERAARVRLLSDMGRPPGKRHVHEDRGTRGRLGELDAGLIDLELSLLPGWLKRRQAIADYYDTCFADSPVGTPPVLPGHRHAYYKYAVACPDLPGLTDFLAHRGIQAEQVYPYLLPDQPAFRAIPHRSETTTRSAGGARRLCLPAYPELTDAEVEHVAASVLAHADGRGGGHGGGRRTRTGGEEAR
ncbi:MULTISPECIES: DegT/DnrJ/EryC1/StrS aminotransferase family protein [unclassified Streptomyces]|uniref:DegT/DnrJ/EryC1/StrS family aminotransferase n=1 Tax=unclassified Streptomyces TaxID=2593676 RepID=UPI00278C3553|nr:MULTISPECIES: DegT/DnrJ/EryC1/StrS family aminotransferase [unclassified Streptomyces]